MSKIVFDPILGKLEEDPEGGGTVSFQDIQGDPHNNQQLNTVFDHKITKQLVTYATDDDAGMAKITPSSGETCLVKSTGKIHTYDGASWDAGTLGATGAIYISEGESYIYDTNKFVLLSTENAMTLNGKQDTYFATATNLSAHIADTTPHVTTAEKTAWNGKAEKAANPTANHLAKLDASGNIVDAGFGDAPSDNNIYARHNGDWCAISMPGDNERLIVQVSSSDGLLPLQGIQITVSYQNGDTPSVLTTNASGECEVYIHKGRLYTISAEAKTGYVTPSN